MSKAIRLLADKDIPLPKQLANEIALSRYDPAEGIPGNVEEFDALLVRTVSPINETTIPEHRRRLAFIGSPTAGYDHVNKAWLNNLGITFAYAPGCNASSVGEYVGVSLLIWSLKTQTDPGALTAGVVGAGHAGGAVTGQLSKMGIPCKCYDPPREMRDPDFTSAPLEEVLDCDLLTFHTPLTHDCRWPTLHWLDEHKLENRFFKLVINTARGGVVDEQALHHARQKGAVENYILDVWENEPVFNDRIARDALLRTPHIAGYSIQSKRRASTMILESLYHCFSLPLPVGGFAGQFPPPPHSSGGGTVIKPLEDKRPVQDREAEESKEADKEMGPFHDSKTGECRKVNQAMETDQSTRPNQHMEKDRGGKPGEGFEADLLEILYKLNPLGEYDREFRTLIGLDPAAKSRAFQKLRTELPLRHEHPWLRVDPSVLEKFPVLEALGVSRA